MRRLICARFSWWLRVANQFTRSLLSVTLPGAEDFFMGIVRFLCLRRVLLVFSPLTGRIRLFFYRAMKQMAVQSLRLLRQVASHPNHPAPVIVVTETHWAATYLSCALAGFA